MSDESTNVQPWMRVILKAEPHFTEIAEADGNLVTFKREAMFAHQLIEGSSYLQSCTSDSVFNAIVNVASVGITLSPAEKLAYLVPRWNKDLKSNVCCLDISYRGLKKIAEDSGAVATAVAELVRENDKWEWIDKLTKPLHKYDPMLPSGHRGDIRGGYCIAVLPNGLVQVEPMSLEEIEKIQDSSQAKNGPWKTWWEEMAKKTLVRRASKMWPHGSGRLSRAIAVLDQHQGLLPAPIAETPLEPPKGASEVPPGDALTGAPVEPGEAPKAKGDPNGEKPMAAQQVKILRARMKHHDVSEERVVKKFGAIEEWKWGQFQTIQRWVNEGGKD